jgi:hypothetical protein
VRTSFQVVAGQNMQNENVECVEIAARSGVDYLDSWEWEVARFGDYLEFDCAEISVCGVGSWESKDIL